MTGRVTVVGLGPAGGDLVTPAARRALASVALPLTRTATHPAVADLAAEGIVLRALDAHYESATSLAATYAGIVDEVLDVAERDGEVVYSVPGNPAVAERTVALIRERLSDDLAEDPERLRIVAGLSFAELAWSRVGVDPQNGARLVDGHRFSTDAAGVSGPMLIAQCDRMSVLSEVKLTLLEILEPNTPVTVLQRLGSPDESVSDVALVDLDRVVEADPRTSVFVDTGEQTVAAEMAEFVALMARLRGPGGCPWDAEQTHRSLGRYVLEEAYEVVEAVQALPPAAPAGEVDPVAYAALADELGDLLCQVVFHATLATEAGAFDISDVIDGIHTKLVRRHPHVFGDVAVDGPGDVLRNWEQIKRDERGTASLLVGVDASLPALLYTHKLLRKASSVGLDVSDPTVMGLTARRALDDLTEATDPDAVSNALGRLLAAAVVSARANGVDAESSLRGWAVRFRDRFAAMEDLARERGTDLTTLDAPAVTALWNDAERELSDRELSEREGSADRGLSR